MEEGPFDRGIDRGILIAELGSRNFQSRNSERGTLIAELGSPSLDRVTFDRGTFYLGTRSGSITIGTWWKMSNPSSGRIH